jgi:hypothetical protein
MIDFISFKILLEVPIFEAINVRSTKSNFNLMIRRVVQTGAIVMYKICVFKACGVVLSLWKDIRYVYLCCIRGILDNLRLVVRKPACLRSFVFGPAQTKASVALVLG